MRRTIFETEHDDFREAVRGFLLREAVPHAEAWERAGVVDRGFWRRAAAQGMVGFSIPERHGGPGLDDFRFNAVVGEEVAATGAVGDGFSLTNDIVAPYFVELADEQQQARWLVAAIAMSEPGTGSDLRAIEATARWDGDVWRLSGSKTFVTSGIQADLVIVAARAIRDGVDGMGLFVAEASMEGFQRGRKLEKVGRKAQDTAELFFDDVAIPPENVLGEPGRGLRYLMRNLPQERLSIAVTAVAAAERALELTLQYVKDRNAFGRPIGSFQANRFLLADLATELQVARSHVDRCIAAHVARELDAAEAAGAKAWTTDVQWRVVDACLQLHGGYGYMEEYEIARLWRDARVQRIYGGTNEIMREIVGRSLGL
jgi:acyl-CoA dehydrogenase